MAVQTANSVVLVKAMKDEQVKLVGVFKGKTFWASQVAAVTEELNEIRKYVGLSHHDVKDAIKNLRTLQKKLDVTQKGATCDSACRKRLKLRRSILKRAQLFAKQFRLLHRSLRQGMHQAVIASSDTMRTQRIVELTSQTQVNMDEVVAIVKSDEAHAEQTFVK